MNLVESSYYELLVSSILIGIYFAILSIIMKEYHGTLLAIERTIITSNIGILVSLGLVIYSIIAIAYPPSIERFNPTILLIINYILMIILYILFIMSFYFYYNSKAPKDFNSIIDLFKLPYNKNIKIYQALRQD